MHSRYEERGCVMGSLQDWLLILLLALGVAVVAASSSSNQGQVVVVTTQPSPSVGPVIPAMLFLGTVLWVLTVLGPT